jgi:hypothetical protein
MGACCALRPQTLKPHTRAASRVRTARQDCRPASGLESRSKVRVWPRVEGPEATQLKAWQSSWVNPACTWASTCEMDSASRYALDPACTWTTTCVEDSAPSYTLNPCTHLDHHIDGRQRHRVAQPADLHLVPHITCRGDEG